MAASNGVSDEVRFAYHPSARRNLSEACWRAPSWGSIPGRLRRWARSNGKRQALDLVSQTDVRWVNGVARWSKSRQHSPSSPCKSAIRTAGFGVARQRRGATIGLTRTTGPVVACGGIVVLDRRLGLGCA